MRRLLKAGPADLPAGCLASAMKSSPQQGRKLRAMDVSRRTGEDRTAMKPEGVVFNVVTALSAKAAAVVGVLD
jgi:hypothetical protein